MKSAWRLPIIVALALALTGCQPPHYRIKAFADDKGQLWFDAHFVGSWPLKWDDDGIEIEKLEVVSAGSVLWAIERDEKAADCKDSPSEKQGNAELRYPIRYGDVRLCFKDVVAPRKLPIGQKIIVRAHDFNNGFGEFSLQKPVVLYSATGDPFEDFSTQDWPTAWPSPSIAPATPSPTVNATDR